MSRQDMDMFSLAVHDALSGVDISERYPTFFQKMVANLSLYQAFLDAVAILEADGRQELIPVPPTTASELTFLKKEPAVQPRIDQATAGKWRITWNLLFDQLQQLLFPAPDLVYRRAAPLLEDESIILLHEVAAINKQQVEAVLEAIRPVAQPEILRLQLMAAGEEPLPSMQATLRWGSYTQTAVLDTYGRAHFPPLSLDDILDESGQMESGALHLVLESPPT